MLIEFEFHNAPVGYEREVFKDRRGFDIAICEISEALIPSLIQLYKNFDIEAQFQGVPPAQMDMRKAWLQGLLRRGVHLTATLGENEIVGHAALLELPARKSCEFIVVVMKDHRDNGIGTKLCEASIKWARLNGFKSIWLMVSASNARALHVYKKVGFQQRAREEGEVEMEIEVGE